MLKDLLMKNRSAILRAWTDRILETYPADAQNFMKNQKNVFANPVGAAVSSTAEKMYDWLLQGPEAACEDAFGFLDDTIRIRAVQDFTPADAVGFPLLLKPVVREILGKEIRNHNLFPQLLAFESRIDTLTLLSFDIYVQCREKIFEIRATELRDRTSRILQRACQKWGMPEDW
jgi:hypothetical protein